MRKPRDNVTATVMWFFLYLFVVWFALIFAMSYEDGKSIVQIAPNIATALDDPFSLSLNKHSLKFIGVFSLLFGTGLAMYYSSVSKRRIGEEHGSASFGNPKSVSKTFQQDKNTDRIFTQNVRMGMNTRKHRRNLNTIVIGGSGAGKTRFYAKPNILQCNTSFVITDPKGEALATLGNALIENGYNIKVLDLVDFERSDGYNPFMYIRDDKDIIKLINNLIRNTTPKNSTTNDPFWEKSETALLQALMFYLVAEAPPEEQNFSMVMQMIEYAEVKEEDDSHVSPLDILFDALEYDKPNCLACKQYSVFKQASGKTAKSILVSVAVRLATFNLQQIKNITDHDEMHIKNLGEEKTALFAIIPDNDTSFNYLVGMLYTQIFIELYYQADKVHGGRLPVPVHFVLDEFANVALPEDFEKCLATMRSREIYASVIIQNLAQLKDLFKGSQNTWETIVGNCDSLLFLGGNEKSTHKYISELLGKETIETRSYGHSKGRNGSYSTNKQITGRELLTPDEVRLIDNDYALLFIRGAKAIWDKKYNLLSHRNIHLTPDGERGFLGKILKHEYETIPDYIHEKALVKTESFVDTFDFEKAHNYIIIDEN